MNCYALILAVAAFIASCSAKPSGLLPAPLVAAPVAYTAPVAAPVAYTAPVAAPVAYSAPIVTSRSSQVVQRNFNAIAAPVLTARYAYAAPAVAAPVVAAPAKLVAPAVAAPLAAPVAAPAKLVAPAVAAPVAAPAVAPAFAAPITYYI